MWLDLNQLRAFQTIALKGVMVPDVEYHTRRIFRWYSKTFSTPLHLVQTLPLEDVLIAYYEEYYESLDDEKRESLRTKFIETDEEREAREAAAEDDLDDDEEFLKMVEAEEQRKLAEAQPNTQQEQQPRKKRTVQERDSELPEEVNLPEIKMVFKSIEDFERQIAEVDARGL